MIFITLRLVHINYHHKSQLCFCNQRYLKFHVCNIRNMKFWSMLIALNVCKYIHNGIYAEVVVSFIVCQTLSQQKEITNFQSYYQLNIFFWHEATCDSTCFILWLFWLNPFTRFLILIQCLCVYNPKPLFPKHNPAINEH